MQELMAQLDTELFKTNAVDDQLGLAEVETADDDEEDFSQAFSNETIQGMLAVTFTFTTSDANDPK